MDGVKIEIPKKALKDALSKAKRVIGKTDKIIIKKDEGKDFIEIIANSEFLGTFHYVKTEQENLKPFGFQVDPKIIDKWLTGKDRMLEFIVEDGLLKLPEAKKQEEIIMFEQKSPNLYSLNYQDFTDSQVFVDSLVEASKIFQKNEEIYSSFLKVTNKNTATYDPISVCVFFVEEDFEFEKGSPAIEKSAVDVLAKSIKKPKNLQYFVSGKNFIIKDENDFYIAKLEENIMFPTVRYLKILSKKDFTLNVDELKEKLKSYKNDDVPKVAFEKVDDNTLRVIPRNAKGNYEEFEIQANVKDFSRSVFQLKLIKGFLEGFEGEVLFSHMEYKTKAQQEQKENPNHRNYYMWGYKDTRKSKMVAGILEPLKTES